MEPWIPLCRPDQLPSPGRARGFDLEGQGRDQLFVVHKAGSLHAYLNSCPHWPTATLPWRKDAYLDTTGNYIMCHGHGARFTVDSGECVSGPCVGQRLTAVALKVEEEVVWIRRPTLQQRAGVATHIGADDSVVAWDPVRPTP